MTVCKKCQKTIKKNQKEILGSPDGVFSKGVYHQECYDSERRSWAKWATILIIAGILSILIIAAVLVS